jgi:hypothetical protein
VPSIPSKQMLEVILKTATLSARDRETFEGMWDAVHRYGGLSKRQVSWIEDVYYKQKLAEPGRPAPKRSRKVGFIVDPTVSEIKRAHTMAHFESVCPQIVKDSALYKRVEAFFKSGGELFELRPSSALPKVSKV